MVTHFPWIFSFHRLQLSCFFIFFQVLGLVLFTNDYIFMCLIKFDLSFIVFELLAAEVGASLLCTCSYADAPGPMVTQYFQLHVHCTCIK